MNRKGIFEVIVFLIVAFIVFLFFASWMYGFGLITEQVEGLGITDNNINLTDAGKNTFGQVNSALPALKWIALVMVIGMIMSIMISNLFVKAHPAFFIVYILITIVSVVLAVSISNAYESLLTSANPLTDTLQSFGAMDFIMLNLPIWALIVGIMGAIFLFIGITLDRESGGGIPI